MKMHFFLKKGLCKFQMKWTVSTCSCFLSFTFQHIAFLETHFYFKFYSAFVYLKSVSVLKHHGASWMTFVIKIPSEVWYFRCCTGKYLTPGLLVRVEYGIQKKEKPQFILFADFHEIQIPIIACFKLVTWYHWMYH